MRALEGKTRKVSRGQITEGLVHHTLEVGLNPKPVPSPLFPHQATEQAYHGMYHITLWVQSGHACDDRNEDVQHRNGLSCSRNSGSA